MSGASTGNDRYGQFRGFNDASNEIAMPIAAPTPVRKAHPRWIDQALGNIPCWKLSESLESSNESAKATMNDRDFSSIIPYGSSEWIGEGGKFSIGSERRTRCVDQLSEEPSLRATGQNDARSTGDEGTRKRRKKEEGTKERRNEDTLYEQPLLGRLSVGPAVVSHFVIHKSK